MFDKIHITGLSASFPGDISLEESSDDDVAKAQKTLDDEVEVPADEMINHICQHGYTSQNMLAVCDFDMRFIFVVAGWPGSAHDIRIPNHVLANFPSFPVPP